MGWGGGAGPRPIPAGGIPAAPRSRARPTALAGGRRPLAVGPSDGGQCGPPAHMQRGGGRGRLCAGAQAGPNSPHHPPLALPLTPCPRGGRRGLHTSAHGAAGQEVECAFPWHGNADIVRALLASGARTDVADLQGFTPLHYATGWRGFLRP